MKTVWKSSSISNYDVLVQKKYFIAGITSTVCGSVVNCYSPYLTNPKINFVRYVESNIVAMGALAVVKLHLVSNLQV